jgi:hypothetical protein
MSTSKKSDWTPLPPDITIWFIIPLIGILAGMILPFLSHLRRQGSIGAFAVAVALGAVGILLLFFARLPLYRRRQFLTFGPRQLDAQHRKLYWWAYGFVAVSVLLLVRLLVSVW